MVVTLLLVPVLMLFELQPMKVSQVRHESRYQIATMFVATLVFSTSCSIFTKAGRQEVYVAPTAYCAMLVVFMGTASNVVAVSSNR